MGDLPTASEVVFDVIVDEPPFVRVGTARCHPNDLAGRRRGDTLMPLRWDLEIPKLEVGTRVQLKSADQTSLRGAVVSLSGRLGIELQ